MTLNWIKNDDIVRNGDLAGDDDVEIHHDAMWHVEITFFTGE